MILRSDEGAFIWECDGCHVQTVPFTAADRSPSWWTIEEADTVEAALAGRGWTHYCPACQVLGALGEADLRARPFD